MARCASCGAEGQGNYGEVRLFCPQCGARMVVGVVDLEAYRTSPERFERVAIAPGIEAARAHTPELSAGDEVMDPVVRLVFGSLAVLFFAAVAVSTRDWKVMAFVAVVSGVWLFAAARAVVIGMRRVRAPTERVVAVVTSDSYVTQGPKRDPVGTCEHVVGVREADARERTLHAPASLMGDVAVGDIGMAYVRYDRLVDYRWFDVMAPPLEPGEVPRAAGCTGCGAHQPFGPAGERCAYCDAALAQPDLGEFGARFRAAAASPEARAAIEQRTGGDLPSLFPAIGMTGAAIFACWVAFQFRGLIADAIDWSPWFALLLLPPSAFVAVALWLWWSLTGPRRAPATNQLAVVVRTRSQLVGRKKDKEWQHFVTLASPSGARRELHAMKRVADAAARGQIGVARIRGEWLAAFTSLEA